MMSSGIPSLPKKQLRAESADADSENEETPNIQDESDADVESGDAGSEINESDDESTSGTLTSGGDDSDETEDEDVGGGAGADSGDEGAQDGEGEGEGEGEGDEGGIAAQTRKTKKKRTASSSASGRKKNMEDDMTLLGVPHGIQFDDDEDDESSDDDRDSSEYFQKLKRSVHESYIDTYHPESMSHNYDEIQTLARVVRNNAGVIVDDLHRTIPIMTKYEKTRILGQRAKQLNEGSPAFIKIDSTVIDGYLIAVKELEQKKTPFIIRRPLPNGGSEYWRVQDLEIL